MHPLVVAAAAIAISMLVIPVMWRLAPVLGMVDMPDPRKVHSEPVPRVGGWGIVLGVLIPLTLWVPLDSLMICYLFGSVVLLVFGAIDDCKDIGHWGKFAGQFLAVVPLVYVGDLYVERLPFMGTATLPLAVAKPFTVFALVGMVNAINHSDGLDGLAGGESLLSLIVIAALAYLSNGTEGVLIAAATIGGILGFLRFNTHPARVFMGDAGSQFLGFTLGFLALLLTQRINPALSPALPALFLGLPIVDILAVFAQRARQGRSWFEATRNHIHHRLLDLDVGHYETVVIIYSVQTFLVVSAIFLRYERDVLVLGLYGVVCGGVFALIMAAERRRWRARVDGRGHQLSQFVEFLRQHPLFTTVCAGVISIAVPVYMVAGSLLVERVTRDLGVVSAALAGVLLLEIAFGKGTRSVIVRVVTYVTAVFVVYLTVSDADSWPASVVVAELVFFAVLAGSIWLAVRYSRRDVFRTTPMDYLIVFAVTTLGVFSTSFLSMQFLGVLVIKSMVLLYGCEALINRMPRRLSGLSIACLVTLTILAWRGLAL